MATTGGQIDLGSQRDPASVGIILCKSKNRLIAEYALRDTHKPIGVSDYKLTKALPEKLKGTLPTIKELEAELIASGVTKVNTTTVHMAGPRMVAA
ncbi:MAG: DUF1016 family protein [Elusimicrobia bacterium]|nr:DUF1016 family protein [Elusimicrobiota bacterium]